MRADEREALTALLAEVGIVSVRLHTLRAALRAVLDAGQGVQMSAAEGDRLAPLQQALESAGEEKDEIANDFRERLRPLVEEDAEIKRLLGDDVEYLLLAAERGYRDWPSASDVWENFAAARRAEADFDDAVTRANYLTAPSELNDELEKRHIGGSVPFAQALGEEVDENDRRAFLESLASRPKAVHGVVDVRREVVYKTARTTFGKVLFCLAPIFAVLLAVGLIELIAHLDEWVSMDIDELKSAKKLLEVFLLCVGGGFAHVLVSAGRGLRFKADVPIYVAAAALDWLHLRALAISAFVIPMFITAIGLRFTDFTIDGTDDAFLAFLAGYSADSFALLISKRLNAAVESFGKAARME